MMPWQYMGYMARGRSYRDLSREVTGTVVGQIDFTNGKTLLLLSDPYTIICGKGQLWWAWAEEVIYTPKTTMSGQRII